MIALLLYIALNISNIDYIANNSFSVDTLKILSEEKVLSFKIDGKTEEVFSISNRGKLKDTFDSVYINYCTSKVIFDTFEDVKKKPIRNRYSLMLVQDSILYNLTWSAPKGTITEASDKLFLLRDLLLCSDNECCDKLFINLK